jgi:hypothetical protein
VRRNWAGKKDYGERKFHAKRVNKKLSVGKDIIERGYHKKQ